MNIEKSLEGSKLFVKVIGRINTVTAPQFAEAFHDLESVDEIEIDFAELEQITSAGLRVLLEVQCNMTNKGGTMVVKNINELVNEIFVLTGFINFLTIE